MLYHLPHFDNMNFFELLISEIESAKYLNIYNPDELHIFSNLIQAIGPERLNTYIDLIPLNDDFECFYDNFQNKLKTQTLFTSNIDLVLWHFLQLSQIPKLLLCKAFEKI